MIGNDILFLKTYDSCSISCNKSEMKNLPGP